MSRRSQPTGGILWLVAFAFSPFIQNGLAQSISFYSDGACGTLISTASLSSGQCFHDMPSVSWASYSWPTDVGAMYWYNNDVSGTACGNGASDGALAMQNVGWVAGCHSYNAAVDAVNFRGVQFVAQTTTLQEIPYTPTAFAPPPPAESSNPPPQDTPSSVPANSIPNSAILITPTISASDSVQPKETTETSKGTTTSRTSAKSSQSTRKSPPSSTFSTKSSSSQVSSTFVSGSDSTASSDLGDSSSSAASSKSDEKQTQSNANTETKPQGMVNWQKTLIIGLSSTLAVALAILYFCCRCTNRRQSQQNLGFHSWQTDSKSWDSESHTDSQTSYGYKSTMHKRQPSHELDTKSGFSGSRTEAAPQVPWTPTVVSHRMDPSAFIPPTSFAEPYPLDVLSPTQPTLKSPGSVSSDQRSKLSPGSPSYRKPVSPYNKPLSPYTKPTSPLHLKESTVVESSGKSGVTPISRWLQQSSLRSPTQAQPTSASWAPKNSVTGSAFQSRTAIDLDDDDYLTSVSRARAKPRKTQTSFSRKAVPVSEYILDPPDEETEV